MRRSIGTVMLTLGVFCLAMAALLRFYAAPKLVVAPTDEFAILKLKTDSGSYLSEGKTVQAPLVSTTTLRGDTKASNEETAVWDYFSSLEDATSGKSLSTGSWRMAFDRETAQLSNCCGVTVEDNPGVKQSGIGVLFPVGGMDKKTYQRFDLVTGRAWPAVFQGEEKVGDIDAYKFSEKIEPTSVFEQFGVTGGVLGLDPKKAYDIDKVYAAEITVWVDPRTGVVIDQRQQIDTRVKSKDGTVDLPALAADLRMDEATRKQQAETSGDAATKIQALRLTGPIGSLILGVLLLVGGAAALRDRGRHRQGSSPAVEAPAPSVAETTVTDKS
ncbi:DUF3068 domain-containing protein [Actinocorallia longicatena]|uniref:DUF3068 domain-containing protein n=1 Tax=Actinocorallia longicatena TaxID=111803 RepID=A0ABP6Q5I0_9ACTN